MIKVEDLEGMTIDELQNLLMVCVLNGAIGSEYLVKKEIKRRKS